MSAICAAPATNANSPAIASGIVHADIAAKHTQPTHPIQSPQHHRIWPVRMLADVPNDVEFAAACGCVCKGSNPLGNQPQVAKCAETVENSICPLFLAEVKRNPESGTQPSDLEAPFGRFSLSLNIEHIVEPSRLTAAIPLEDVVMTCPTPCLDASSVMVSNVKLFPDPRSPMRRAVGA